MVEIEFRVKVSENWTLVEFELPNAIELSELPEILKLAPSIDARKGVIISGRGPIWLHSALAHHYHPTRWVAHYDPRVGGAVVVQSHDPRYRVGDVIELEAEKE